MYRSYLSYALTVHQLYLRSLSIRIRFCEWTYPYSVRAWECIISMYERVLCIYRKMMIASSERRDKSYMCVVKAVRIFSTEVYYRSRTSSLYILFASSLFFRESEREIASIWNEQERMNCVAHREYFVWRNVESDMTNKENRESIVVCARPRNDSMRMEKNIYL